MEVFKLLSLSLLATLTAGALLITFTAKWRADQNCPKLLTYNETQMRSLFRMTSTKASMFLSAINYEEHKGDLQWREEHPFQRSVFLQNGTRVMAQEKGYYLTFVQVTYQLKGSHCWDLSMVVNLHYRQGPEQVSSTWSSVCKSGDAVLSHLVLLWMEPQVALSVTVAHRELVDYNHQPAATFLTFLKYSD